MSSPKEKGGDVTTEEMREGLYETPTPAEREEFTQAACMLFFVLESQNKNSVLYPTHRQV